METTVKKKDDLITMMYSLSLVKGLICLKVWVIFFVVQFLTSITAVIQVCQDSAVGVAETFVKKWFIEDLQWGKWLLCAMLADLITGVLKAIVKAKSFRVISSSGLRRSVVKFVSYGMFIWLSHILTHAAGANQKPIIPEMEFMATWSIKVLIVIEAISVIENLTAVNKDLAFLSNVIKKLRGIKNNPE